MTEETEQKQLKALRDFAAGLVGTRETMRRTGISDYAELVIALMRNNLDLPKPTDTPRRRENLERATAVLQPLLRHGR